MRPLSELAASDCVLWQGFDASKAANMYSQLAGVLAGFAFAALMLLLSRQHRREPQSPIDERTEHQEDTRYATALACAFLGLIASSALYAVLSAEDGCGLVRGRAASSMVLAGVSFAFSIYTLFFAAAQLVSAASLGVQFRFIVSVITPPIVIVFVAASLPDLALAGASPPNQDQSAGNSEVVLHWNEGGASFWRATSQAVLWIPPSMFALCSVIWVAARLWRRTHHPGRFAGAALTALPYASLCLVIYSVGRSLSGSHSGPGAYLGALEAWILLGICSVVVLLQSLFLSLQAEGSRSTDPARLPLRTTRPVDRAGYKLAALFVAVAYVRSTFRR